MKNFIFSMVAVMALAIGITSCNCSTPAAKFNNDLDSLGYSYGVLFGSQYSNFTDSGVVVPEKTMELDNFLAGFITAIKRDSANLKMTPEEAESFVRSFQQKIQEEMRAKAEEELKNNKAKGAEFMAKNATEEGVVTLESGLQIKTLVEGNGKQPSADDKVLSAPSSTALSSTLTTASSSTSIRLSRASLRVSAT